MRRTDLFIGICMAILLTSAGLKAQQANSGTTGQAVTMNRLITFNGTLKDSSGQPRLGTAGVTFGIYTSQEGGDPLWRESQTVQTDEQGRYTVLLGSTEKEGLPLEVFSNGRAQWLGVEVQGEKEQARVLLWAVPYALKAADADTVGGKPLSSFVLYEDLSKAIEKQTAPILLAMPSAIPSSDGSKSPTLSGSSRVAAKGARVQASGGSIGRVYGNETGTNTWYGQGAGASITSGTEDSFFGMRAGYNNTTGSNNSFLGNTAGYNNTTGNSNTLVGYQAGYSNTTGFLNSFFGINSGYYNTTGYENSFFGEGAGYSNTTGFLNSFLGSGAGNSNTTGGANSFVGTNAGNSNTTGGSNSFVGTNAGHSNTTGGSNSFVGYSAGPANTTESNNSFIGAYSDGAGGITNATAIGYQAKVTQSNSLVLGSINGVNGATANTYVGIGTTNPATELQVISTKSTQPRGISSFQFSNDNLSAIVRGGKARGTATSPSAVQSQDGIFNMQADGYGATGYLYNIGGFQFAAEATFTNSSAPTYWRVLTTPSGTTLPTEKIRITGAGNVGIGTTAPTERLHVVGNIRVTGGITYGAPETDIPDYVFEPDYKLMRIEELEKFIGKEKHLPNMPQASEIKEKGLNLSEFQMKLLEKIEELTLYTVQQAKTINRKDEEIKGLNARLTALEQVMEQMTKQQAEAREQK